jgi:hypothetical protein
LEALLSPRRVIARQSHVTNGVTGFRILLQY